MKKILLIEDNPDHTLLIKRLLKDTALEFEIDTASTGKEGIEKITSQKYDLLLLDYLLPDMNGIEVLREVMKHRPALPVIVLTVQHDERKAITFLKMGAKSYLTKDEITPEILRQKLIQAIQLEPGKKQILVIEDNPDHYELYEKMLKGQSSKFNLIRAASFKEAIQFLRNYPFELIITDLNLPDLNPKEILKKLKSEFPNIPLIVISGTYQDMDTVREVYRSGAWSFLTKDELTPSLFIKTINQTLEDKERISQIRLLFKVPEKKLFEEQAIGMYRALIETMNEGLIGFDFDGTITFLNKKVEEIVNCVTPNELLGKNIFELLDENERGKLKQELEKVKIGKKTSYETTIRYNNNSTPIMLSLSPLLDTEGKISSACCIITDLTELKKHQKELDEIKVQLTQVEKITGIGLLAGGIAHELNNPLTVILGYTELLLKKLPPTSEVYQVLLEMNKQSLRCKNIIKNLLLFARSGEMEFSDVDINSLLDETIALIGFQLEKSRVQIIKDYTPNLPKIRGNPVALQQVFFSIIMNAFDAMPNGGKLYISTSYHQDRNLSIKFKDTGIGMPQSVVEKVFEPFFTTKPVGRGTGLGLPSALGIVKQHNGDIIVESKVGEGTTFTVVLPNSTTQNNTK